MLYIGTPSYATCCKVGICHSLRNGWGRGYELSVPTSVASSQWHPILPKPQESTLMQAADVAHIICALSL